MTPPFARTLTIGQIERRLREGHAPRGECDTSEGGSCDCGYEEFLHDCVAAYLEMRRAAELRDEIARTA